MTVYYTSLFCVQEYFSDELIKIGISTSGLLQQDTIQHIMISESLSDNVGQNTLDKFFEASSIEEQRDCFQSISSGLEKMIL